MEKPDVESLRVWKNLPTTKYIFKEIDDSTLKLNDQMSSLVKQGATRDEVADKALYLSGYIDGIRAVYDFLEEEIAAAKKDPEKSPPKTSFAGRQYSRHQDDPAAGSKPSIGGY